MLWLRGGETNSGCEKAPGQPGLLELSPSDGGERLGGPRGAASVHLSLGVKGRPGASDQMPKPFLLNRHCLCPPADKTSRGPGGPGGLGQRRLCAYPEPGEPSSRGCPPGAGGCDLLSYFPSTFTGHLWEIFLFPVPNSYFSREKEALWVSSRESLGEKGPEKPFSLAFIPPGSRLWNLLLTFTQILGPWAS